MEAICVLTVTSQSFSLVPVLPRLLHLAANRFNLIGTGIHLVITLPLLSHDTTLSVFHSVSLLFCFVFSVIYHLIVRISFFSLTFLYIY